MKNRKLKIFIARMVMVGLLVQHAVPLMAAYEQDSVSEQPAEITLSVQGKRVKSEDSINSNVLIPTAETSEQIVVIDDEQLEHFIASIVKTVARNGTQETLSEEMMIFCEQLLTGKKEFSVGFLCKVVPQLLTLANKSMEEERAMRPNVGFQDGSIVGPLLSCNFDQVLALLHQIFNFLMQCCATIEFDLNGVFTLLNTDFNGTFTFLNEIENTLTTCCAIVENDLNGVFTLLNTDFNGTFTFLDEIENTLTTCCAIVENDLNGVFTALAALTVTVTVDFTDVFTTLDDINNTLTTCCAIVENDLNGVFTVLNTDFNGVFTALADLSVTVTVDFTDVFTTLDEINNTLTTCCAIVENDLNGVFTALKDIGITFTVDITNIFTTLEDINNTLTTCCANIEFDFNGIFTTVTDIIASVSTDFTLALTTLIEINNTLTECCANITNEFNGTFTVLNDIENTLTTCCATVETDLNGVFTLLNTDFNGTFTFLNEIENTLTTCCAIVETDLNGVFTLLNTDFNGTFTVLASLMPACPNTVITQSAVNASGGTYTISNPGNYSLSSDITSTAATIIVIDADQVTLDLCGRSIIGAGVDSGDQIGITVEAGLSDIAITNGDITNMSMDGIFVNSGVSDLSISNIAVNNTGRSGINLEGNSESLITEVVINNCTISLTATGATGIAGLVLNNCDTVAVQGGNFDRNGSLTNVAGILVNACNDCVIDAATMNLNTSTGLLLVDSQNSVVNNVVISRNTGAGIDLSGSSFNTFNNCAITRTVATANNSAYGIRALGGGSNRFENCIIDGTSTAATSSDFEATGILIGSDEQADIIINNQVSNSTASSSGLPFGIHMDYTFTALSNSSLPSITIGTTIDKVAWSPNDKYLAVSFGTLSTTIAVYAFDRDILDLVQVATVALTNACQDLAWSPDGTYLATVEPNGVNGLLRVFLFNGVSLNQIATAAVGTDGGVPESVSWNANGRFIAVVGNATSLTRVNADPTVYVFEFTGSLLNQVATTGVAGTVNAVAWGPQNNYLAVGAIGLLDVFKFTGGTTLTLAASLSLGTDSANSVDWAVDGRTLVISNTTGISVVEFTGVALTPITSVSTGVQVNDAHWSSDGQYVVIGQNEIAGGDVKAYLYNGTSLTLESSYTHGANVSSVAWSRGGEFIAIGGNVSGGKTEETLFGLVFPANTIIRNNEVSGVSGPALASGTPGFSTGRGISASSNSNLIIQNTAFNNDVNYVFVTNTFSQFIANTASQFPSNLANLSFPPL